MKFIDRQEEMKRMDRVMERGEAALVVLWGRRRMGKSRLLTEWCVKHDGLYWVADESAAPIQRRYLASEIEQVFPGFSSVEYPDWASLLNRLSDEAKRTGWRGPFILDEFPYLTAVSPELPSILQKWIDREKRQNGMVLALSGSSQRMMQSQVLHAGAPLYGRADEVLKLEPLLPGYIRQVNPEWDDAFAFEYYVSWGGVPRYWELSVPFGDNRNEALHDLVLSPLGVLHDEIDRLLKQEMPSATPLRPILDAIGMGAHRSSEIAARLQTPATSLARSLHQLQELGYIRREVPFGQNEKRSKKSVYKLADPFLRLWFKVVAAHRGALQSATRSVRSRLLQNVWPQLRGEAWEELCRQAIPRLKPGAEDWSPAGRSWAPGSSEWDCVSTSLDGTGLLLGECKCLNRCAGQAAINKIIKSMWAKDLPVIKGVEGFKKEYWIFVPTVDIRATDLPTNVRLIDAKMIFDALI